MHMVAPAFAYTPALRDRAERIAIGLVDAAILPPGQAKDALSRELLALSSVLAIASTGSLLSPMNAELVSREARLLLQEIAAYEQPRLLLEHAPTLAELSVALRRESGQREPAHTTQHETPRHDRPGVPLKRTPADHQPRSDKGHKGHISDTSREADVSSAGGNGSRSEAIIAILSAKGPSYIKDISTLVHGVSEKTIQRELSSLVADGRVAKKGERRWTTYALAAN